MLQFLAVNTSVETIDIGKHYAYLYHNQLCVGVAIPHPSNKPGDGYTWAMRNCITGKVQYPYQKDIIVPNREIKEVLQQKPIKVYRVENEKEQKGLWRKFDGTWEPLFDMLTDGQCKDMPMEDSSIYREGGKQWFASAPSKETLQKWFSRRDLEELTAAGFTITEFEVLEYRKLSDFEFIFTRESIVNKTNINVTDIYPLEQPELCKGWVARNRPNTSPSLVFFYDKPIRQDNGWGDKFWHSPNTWSEEISIPANLFPSLRWEDEPIEVEVVIRNARKEGK